MATKTFISRAAIKSQVDPITLSGTPDAGDTVTATINSRSETYTLVTGDTLTTAAAGLASVLQSSSSPEFQEVTWSTSGAVVTGTSNSAGRPFTLSASAVGMTATRSSLVANSSPSDISVAANWSGGTLPSTGDDWVFESNQIPALYGLGAGYDPASITIRDSFAGPIGLPVYNQTGGYYEYRGTTLTLTADCTLVIDQSTSAGAGHYKFSWNTKVVNATVRSATGGNGVVLGQEAVWLSGLKASSAVNVYGGSVVVCPQSSDTAELTTVRIIDGTFRAGPGVNFTSVTGGTTLAGTSITQTRGVVDIQTSIATWNIDGEGAIGVIRGSATLTSLNIDNGTVSVLSTGTITNLNVGSGATVDFSGVLGAITVTNCTIAAGGTINDPARRVTFANGIKLTRCSMSEVSLDLGVHFTLTPSAY